MNYLRIYTLTISFIIGLLFLQSCKSDEPVKKDKELEMLTGTWGFSSAMIDGQVADGYGDFELTLSGSNGASVYTYATVGRPDFSPWPSGGTWSFGSDKTTRIMRDPGMADELTITYSATETTLEIEFYSSGKGYPGGRLLTTEGEWSFSFSRK